MYIGSGYIMTQHKHSQAATTLEPTMAWSDTWMAILDPVTMKDTKQVPV